MRLDVMVRNTLLLVNHGHMHNLLLVDGHVHINDFLHVNVMGTFVLLNCWDMHLNVSGNGNWDINMMLDGTVPDVRAA